MKKISVLFLLLFLLLTGCGIRDDTSAETTEPIDTEQETTEEVTLPPISWIDALGMPWDAEGVLLEIPLTIPDGMHYSASMEFDGDLLLWSVDHHLVDTSYLELCVIDLSDGSVIAQRDIPFSNSIVPQVLGSDLYICDHHTGTIHRLDKNLLTQESWQTEPMDGSWYMGAGGKLYIDDWNETVYVRDLATGDTSPLLDGDPLVQYMYGDGDHAIIEYFHENTGARTSAVLDLVTGTVHYPELDEYQDFVYFSGDDWLYGEYGDYAQYTLRVDGGEPVRIVSDDGMFRFLDDKYLLCTDEEDSVLRLYDLQGKLISQCRVSGEPFSVSLDALIWSEEYGGYFCAVNNYGGSLRILFWDIEKGNSGDDLVLEPIPVDSETDALLKQRAKEIGEKYGLTIQVCSDCDTEFDEFSATIINDWDRVNAALDTLEQALSVYPEGFFRQLRYDYMYGIRIQLVCDLMADGSGRYGDGYSAFTQPQIDHYLMVVDIDDTYDNTYYHEFSHIIDSYLEWDSWQREDALYSEETWASLNPDWFSGYSYDYSQEHYLEDITSFVDSYATVSPTEDRARVMEYAMMEYGNWTFEDADILLAKLDYYCRCIRDAFDTEGWPETVLWEQYLYLMN